MKISIDDEEFFTISSHQKQVIENDIPSEKLEEDLKRRIQWIITHKYERCLERLRKEWEPVLKEEGALSIPTKDEDFCALVCSHSKYRNRSQRDSEEN